MEEQHPANFEADVGSPNETPKVIRAGGDVADSANETPKVMRAGGDTEPLRRELQQEASAGSKDAGGFEAAAEAAPALLRAGAQTRESTQPANDAGRENAGGEQLVTELVNCAARSAVRNVQAIGALLQCRTVYSLMQWQRDLLTATVMDCVATNARIFRLGSIRA